MNTNHRSSPTVPTLSLRSGVEAENPKVTLIDPCQGSGANPIKPFTAVIYKF
jgi:hypothetical protein